MLRICRQLPMTQRLAKTCRAPTVTPLASCVFAARLLDFWDDPSEDIHDGPGSPPKGPERAWESSSLRATILRAKPPHRASLLHVRASAFRTDSMFCIDWLDPCRSCTARISSSAYQYRISTFKNFRQLPKSTYFAKI